jgi:hypothetical protein
VLGAAARSPHLTGRPGLSSRFTNCVRSSGAGCWASFFSFIQGDKWCCGLGAEHFIIFTSPTLKTNRQPVHFADLLWLKVLFAGLL